MSSTAATAAIPANKLVSTAVADYHKAVHNPAVQFLFWLAWAAVEAVIGSGIAWVLDWNKLLLASTWTTVGLTALGGVLHALYTFALLRGNQQAAQLLANIEQEVLTRHGVTADMIPMLKQLAISIAPDMLATLEGKAPLPGMLRFTGQPADIAMPTTPPPPFGTPRPPVVMTPVQASGATVGMNTASQWAANPPGQSG